MYKDILTPMTCELPVETEVRNLNGTAGGGNGNETGPGYDVNNNGNATTTNSSSSSLLTGGTEQYCVKVIGTTSK